MQQQKRTHARDRNERGKGRTVARVMKTAATTPKQTKHDSTPKQNQSQTNHNHKQLRGGRARRRGWGLRRENYREPSRDSIGAATFSNDTRIPTGIAGLGSAARVFHCDISFVDALDTRHNRNGSQARLHLVHSRMHTSCALNLENPTALFRRVPFFAVSFRS